MVTGRWVRFPAEGSRKWYVTEVRRQMTEKSGLDIDRSMK